MSSNKKSTLKPIRYDKELLEAIQREIGESGNFSEWVKQACREKLDRELR